MISIQSVVGQEIQIEKAALLREETPDFSKVKLPDPFFIEWPDLGSEPFPADGRIADLQEALKVLNHASLMFDEIKTQYLAFDTTQKEFVNTEYWSGSGSALSIATPLDGNLDQMVSTSLTDTPKIARLYASSILLPSIGEFTEVNWREKLKLLASGVSQLKALPWAGSALEASSRLGSNVWDLNSSIPDANKYPGSSQENPINYSPLADGWSEFNSFNEDWLNDPGNFPMIVDGGKVDNGYPVEGVHVRDLYDGYDPGNNSDSVRFEFIPVGMGIGFNRLTGESTPWWGYRGQVEGTWALSMGAFAGRSNATLSSTNEDLPGTYNAMSGSVVYAISTLMSMSSRVWPQHVTLPDKKVQLGGVIHMGKSGIVTSYGDLTEGVSTKAADDALPIGWWKMTDQATDTMEKGQGLLFQQLNKDYKIWNAEQHVEDGMLVDRKYRSLTSTIPIMYSLLKLPSPPTETTWEPVSAEVISMFELDIAGSPFDTKMMRIGSNGEDAFPKNRRAYSIFGARKWQDGPPDEAGNATFRDLSKKDVVSSGATYNVDTILVCVPKFTALSSTAFEKESLASYGLGTVETAVNEDLVRIHLGRGKKDPNQVAWLTPRFDGFGNPIFHGSPNEFEVLYEKDREQFEAPIGGGRTFDLNAEFTAEQETASGWESWFQYMAFWHSPRLRQIRGGDILVDISYPTSYRKVLKFYWAAGLGPKSGKFYGSLGTPFKVVELSNPTAPKSSAGLPTELRHLRIVEDDKRFHEITVVPTEDGWRLSKEDITIKLSDAADGGNVHRLVEAQLIYAKEGELIDTWTTTETVDGVVSTITEKYAKDFSPRKTDTPVLKSRSISSGGDTRGFTTEWEEPDPEILYPQRRDYRLKKVTFLESPTWESSGFVYEYSARGIPSVKRERIGGKELLTELPLSENESTAVVKLAGQTLSTSTATYSSSGQNQFSSVVRKVNGETVATETYRSASGAGADSGSPWSLEKIVYPGGYQETFKPVWNDGALTTTSRSGWTSAMKSGSEVVTIRDRFGELASGGSYVAKAKGMLTSGGGNADIVVDQTIVSEKTKFGAPKKFSDLRGQTTSADYEETGANWGLPKKAVSAGLPDSGVTAYDWLRRPTEIDGGHESFTVDRSNILKPKATSTSNPGDHWSAIEMTPFGKTLSAESKFGTSSKTTFDPAGGGRITVDGLSKDFAGDVSGVVSKVDGGLGALGTETQFGVESIGGKPCLWVQRTELKRDDTASALVIKTHYDAKGRVVRITRPAMATGASGSVFESWTYDDDARTVTHTPVPVPAPGRPAQTTKTVLDPAGHTLNVLVDGEDRVHITRRAEGNSIVQVVEKLDDGADNGDGVAASKWQQVSKTAISPKGGLANFTPYDLNSNTVSVAQSIPSQGGATTLTNGLTNETVTIKRQNGLTSEVSGTEGGRSIALGGFQHNAGHLSEYSGTVGGSPVGLTIGADRKISTITSLAGTTTLNYSQPGAGSQVSGTLNGQTSTSAVDSRGSLVKLDISGEIAPLSSGTIDLPGGAGTRETIIVPNEPGSLVIERNPFGIVTSMGYSGGGIVETTSLFEDGSPREETISGTVGLGDSVTKTTAWTSAYSRDVSWTGGPSIKESYYKTGAPKAVEQVSASMPDKRAFTFERDTLKTEKHLEGVWAGKTVTFKQDAKGRLAQILVAGGSTYRQFIYGYDGVSRIMTSEMSTGTGTFVSQSDYYPVHGQRRATVSGDVTTLREYTAAGHLTGIEHGIIGNASVHFTYPTRDDHFRITSRTSSLGHGWSAMSYDDRGQLLGTHIANVRDYAYSADSRGNRTGPATEGTYTNNPLDQVDLRSLANGKRGFGLMGAVKPDEDPTTADDDAKVEIQNWLVPNWEELTINPETGGFFQYWPIANDYLNGQSFRAETAVRATVPGAGINGATAKAQTTVYSVVPPATEALLYDKQGRLRQDASWDYVWDGADRLERMTRRAPMPEPSISSMVIDFVYDADGRRVKKTVTCGLLQGAGGFRVETSKVLWAGWLPIMEERTKQVAGGLLQMLPRRWFQWGPDLSGTLDEAGGIGGLVAIHEEAVGTSTIGRTLMPVDDGLGNIIALLDSAGHRVATYEYGPFGEWIGGSGEVGACPFRWQTKWCDAESEHYYFGYRYYNAHYGRWLSRDPLGVAGGFNLYAYCGNDPVNRHDPLGLADSRSEVEARYPHDWGLITGGWTSTGTPFWSEGNLMVPMTYAIQPLLWGGSTRYLMPIQDARVLAPNDGRINGQLPERPRAALGTPAGINPADMADALNRHPGFRAQMAIYQAALIGMPAGYAIGMVARIPYATAVMMPAGSWMLGTELGHIAASDNWADRSERIGGLIGGGLAGSGTFNAGREHMGRAFNWVGSLFSKPAPTGLMKVFGAKRSVAGSTIPEMFGLESVKVRLGEGPEIDAINITSAYRGGFARPPRHHIFPQAEESWFSNRGVSIDDYTVELSEAMHQAIHGGGNWRLGKISPDEWNSNIMNVLRRAEGRKGSLLTADEILAIGLERLRYYRLQHLEILSYVR